MTDQKKPNPLDSLLDIPSIEPAFITIGGDPGVGKSSFPVHYLRKLKPVYILTESLTGVFDHLQESEVPKTFPVLEKSTQADPMKPYNQFMKYTGMLLKEEHDYDLLVLDTASSFEPMLIDGICLGDNVRSLGAAMGGFGRGTEALNSYWQDIAERLIMLRDQRKMTVLVNCHTKLNKVKNSATDDEYNTNGLDLRDGAMKLFSRLCDAILFMRMKTMIRDAEIDKTGRTTKAGKAKVYADRQLITDASAMIGYTQAKNRYRMPSMITLNERNADFELTDLIPYYQQQK